MKRGINTAALVVKLGTAMNSQSSLSLVSTESYSWYELTLRKLNKKVRTRNYCQNKIGLKIVG